jgi:hypothetical protein
LNQARATVTPLSNMNVVSGGKTERVTFSTTIDSELPDNTSIFDLVCKHEMADRTAVQLQPGGKGMVRQTVKVQVMDHVWYTKSGATEHRADGTFTFIYKNRNFKVGKQVGHYWLSAGGNDVQFAGEVTFKHGELTHWDNRSGHFLPHPAMARTVPFPYDKFEPRHVHQIASAKERARKEKEAAEGALRFWGSIDEYLRTADRSGNSRDVMRGAVAKFGNADNQLSNRDIQNRMLSLGLVTDAKRMAWVQKKV